MTIAQFIVAFAMTWWLVFFMVLPFGTQPEENHDGVAYKAAPKHASMRGKYILTTVLALLVDAALWWVIMESGWALY